MQALALFLIIGLNYCFAFPAQQDNAEAHMVSGPTTEVTPDYTHSHDMSTHDHGDGGDTGMGHSMQMSFYASEHVTILFAGWHTMTYAQLFGSCLAIMLMGFLYEGFKVWRISLWGTPTQHTSQVSVATGKAHEDFAGSKSDIVGPHSACEHGSSSEQRMGKALKDKKHIIQALLHTLQLFCSYCLMLIFMTYNIYVCLALVIGSGMGYWLFCWKQGPVASTEHCN